MEESNFDLWSDRRRNFDPAPLQEQRNRSDRREKSIPVEFDRRENKKSRLLIHSRKFQGLLLLLSDLLVLQLALVISSLLVFSPFGGNESVPLEVYEYSAQRFQVFIGWSMICVFVFWLHGHYSRRRAFWDELREIVKIIAILGCVDAAAAFFVALPFNRQQIVYCWVLALLCVPLIRVVVKHGLILAGGWMRPTVIIGVGDNARATAQALSQDPLLGFNVVSFLVPPPSWEKMDKKEETYPRQLDVKGHSITVRRMGTECPVTLLRNLGHPHVVVALDSGDFWEVSKLMHQSGLPDSSLNIVPPVRGLPLVGMEVMHFFKQDIIMLRVQNNLARPIPQIIKRGFDICVSATLLIFLTPLFLMLIPTISYTTKASAIFGHRRIGRHSKEFHCLKFRTMVANADEVLKQLLNNDTSAREHWEKDLKLKDDPRITPIGRFLRKTSLDELPQLWNVLKGEMSLVGPRPIVKEELSRYEEKIDYYLKVRPGMTGLWQVSGRNNVTYKSRVNFDTWYVKNWSLWHDIVVMLKTVKVVFGDKSAY